MRLSRGGEFHGNELVSFLLESFDNFTDKSTLDAIGLDHNVYDDSDDDRRQRNKR